MGHGCPQRKPEGLIKGQATLISRRDVSKDVSQARRQRHQQLRDGFNIEDVVTHDPRPGSQKRSYGLSLCDDNGESVLMNGVMGWLR